MNFPNISPWAQDQPQIREFIRTYVVTLFIGPLDPRTQATHLPLLWHAYPCLCTPSGTPPSALCRRGLQISHVITNAKAVSFSPTHTHEVLGNIQPHTSPKTRHHPMTTPWTRHWSGRGTANSQNGHATLTNMSQFIDGNGEVDTDVFPALIASLHTHTSPDRTYGTVEWVTSSTRTKWRFPNRPPKSKMSSLTRPTKRNSLCVQEALGLPIFDVLTLLDWCRGPGWPLPRSLRPLRAWRPAFPFGPLSCSMMGCRGMLWTRHSLSSPPTISRQYPGGRLFPSFSAPRLSWRRRGHPRVLLPQRSATFSPISTARSPNTPHSSHFLLWNGSEEGRSGRRREQTSRSG